MKSSYLTEEQKMEPDRRYTDHKNGTGTQYTWDDVIKVARKVLFEKQILMLQLSDKNIEEGRLIPHDELFKKL